MVFLPIILKEKTSKQIRKEKVDDDIINKLHHPLLSLIVCERNNILTYILIDLSLVSFRINYGRENIY
jgi:hypothetical protein